MRFISSVVLVIAASCIFGIDAAAQAPIEPKEPTQFTETDEFKRIKAQTGMFLGLEFEAAKNEANAQEQVIPTGAPSHMAEGLLLRLLTAINPEMDDAILADIHKLPIDVVKSALASLMDDGTLFSLIGQDTAQAEYKALDNEEKRRTEVNRIYNLLGLAQ